MPSYALSSPEAQKELRRREEDAEMMRAVAQILPLLGGALGVGGGALTAGLVSGGNPAAIGAGASVGGGLLGGLGQAGSVMMNQQADRRTSQFDKVALGADEKKRADMEALRMLL